MSAGRERDLKEHGYPGQIPDWRVPGMNAMLMARSAFGSPQRTFSRDAA